MRLKGIHAHDFVADDVPEVVRREDLASSRSWELLMESPQSKLCGGPVRGWKCCSVPEWADAACGMHPCGVLRPKPGGFPPAPKQKDGQRAEANISGVSHLGQRVGYRIT